MFGKRYLVGSDSQHLLANLTALLETVDASVTVVESKQRVLAEARTGAYTAIFLDADSADIDALALCRRLRALIPHAQGAIVLFGERRGDPDTVRGLNEGADDFWLHPFNAPVCLAYFRAIVRRLQPAKTGQKVLKLAYLLADPAQKHVTLKGKPISLRGKEFDLLYLLLLRKGQSLSRELLMKEAWGREYFGTTRTIDFHVAQLRQKLGAWGQRIETVSGVGYRLTTH